MKTKNRLSGLLLVGVFLLGAFALSGCIGQEEQVDNLVVLYPHSGEFADWVFEGFKDYYNDETGNAIEISSILEDSASSYEKVETWNGTNPEADVWWGGGVFWFDQGTGGNLLEGYTVKGDADLLDTFGGWAMKGAEAENGEHTWYAAALSGFGFMYNTEYLAANNLDTPKTWEDLTDHQYQGHIFMADSKASGSTVASIKQQLQAMPYGDAWAMWSQIIANVATFGSSSGGIRDEVAAGTYGIGLVIDYYYYSKVADGSPVGFSFGGATTVSPDPAGIIKNAENLEPAQHFMDYLVSKDGQTRVGKYRPPIREDAPATDPVLDAFDPMSFPAIVGFDPGLDGAVHSRARETFHFWLVINHDDAVAAWTEMAKSPAKHDAAIAEFTKVPELTTTMEDLLALQYREPDVTAALEEHGATQFAAALAAASGA